ncbi:MAG: HD domain-containing protein, partial [Actinobacteria bacterium]|nr:HD domain-containing protein [Actinomycetota bacterium]
MNDEDTAIQALEMGAQDYIIKGQFDTNLLVRAIYYAIERKVLENKFIENAKQLKQSEERYRTLFEESLDGMYRTTIEGEYIDVNMALVRMLGYGSKEELLKLNVKNDIYAPGEKRPGLDKRNKLFETRLSKKNGNIIIVEISPRVVYKNGKPEYYEGIIRDITEKREITEKLDKSYAKLKKTLAQTINAFGSILEAKDPYTYGHQKNVARIAIEIAKELSLSDRKIEAINIAALLHDIGKIYIPASILSKPGKLSELEFKMVKEHPRIGYNIIKGIDFNYPVAEIVLHHHERLDGSGYPGGIKEKDIPIEAKILAVADVVEAMKSHRPYREALGNDKAAEELKTNGGILYDKKVVNTFLSLSLDVEKIKDGKHICSFYDNGNTQFSCIVPFIIGSLKSGQKCLYILDENIQERLRKAFADKGYNISEALKSKQLVFYTKKETYIKDGYFEPEKMINLLRETEKLALEEGYSGVRATGEMSWVLANPCDLEKLIEYENLLNIFFPGSKVSAICQYNVKLFDENVLTDIVATHPMVIIDGL